MWIIVEGGDVFEGDEEQFDDCFGISAQRPLDPDLIRNFCAQMQWRVEILDKRPVELMR